MGKPFNTRYCGSVSAMSTQIFVAGQSDFVGKIAGP
jgi:hypothetical protein